MDVNYEEIIIQHVNGPSDDGVVKVTREKGILLLLFRHLLYGRGEVDRLHGDLHFANAAEEVCDEDAPRVTQEQVGTVARGGHTLAFWTHLELFENTRNGETFKYTAWRR